MLATLELNLSVSSRIMMIMSSARCLDELTQPPWQRLGPGVVSAVKLHIKSHCRFYNEGEIAHAHAPQPPSG